jgi:hypothetical protein
MILAFSFIPKAFRSAILSLGSYAGCAEGGAEPK